jgi:hypothetical protein
MDQSIEVFDVYNETFNRFVERHYTFSKAESACAVLNDHEKRNLAFRSASYPVSVYVIRKGRSR